MSNIYLPSFVKTSDLDDYSTTLDIHTLLASYITSDDLRRKDYVTQTQMNITIPTLPSLSPRLHERLIDLEKEVTDPGCTLKHLEETLKDIQSRKSGSAVTMGGYTFKDINSTKAWTSMFVGSDNARYFVDARMQLGALKTRIKTEHGATQEQADAIKAGFASKKAADTDFLFDVPYPETIFKETGKKDEAARGGITFTPSFATADIFEGDAEYLYIPMSGAGVPTFKRRNDLGDIIQREGLKQGIEIGVQMAHYSAEILSRWHNCTESHLVDLWGYQENYIDRSNINQAQQEKYYADAMERVQPWKEKVHVCKTYTSNCASKYEDEYFVFIYVDARHDFKGVWEDLVNYWPKLKKGGILAGHDCATNDEVLRTGQDWSVNYDGTKDHTPGTVVKGAVDTFAINVCRQVTVSYRDKNMFHSFAIRK